MGAAASSQVTDTVKAASDADLVAAAASLPPDVRSKLLAALSHPVAGADANASANGSDHAGDLESSDDEFHTPAGGSTQDTTPLSPKAAVNTLQQGETSADFFAQMEQNMAKKVGGRGDSGGAETTADTPQSDAAAVADS